MELTFNIELNRAKYTQYNLARERCKKGDVIVRNGDYYAILNKRDLSLLVNSEDIDVRIEAKRLAKELGYAVIPTRDRYEIMPTRRMVV
jgi:hypothetical protein